MRLRTIMDAASTLPTFYLLSAAAFGAALSALAIALYSSRTKAWEVLHAFVLRRIMRDSMKSGDVREFRPRRSR